MLCKRFSESKKWSFPGGEVEDGEDLIAAVKREILEEVAIEVDGVSTICSKDLDNKDIYWVHCKAKTNSIKCDDDVEIGQWFDVSVVIENIDDGKKSIWPEELFTFLRKFDN